MTRAPILLFALLAAVFPLLTARAADEKSPRAPLSVTQRSLFERRDAEREESFFTSLGKRGFLLLSDIENKKERAVIRRGGDSFGYFLVSMRIEKIAGAEHPCPRGGTTLCRFDVEFIGANNERTSRLIRELVERDDTKPEVKQFAILGSIPHDAALGAGTIIISIVVPTLPTPVFLYRIPVTVE